MFKFNKKILVSITFVIFTILTNSQSIFACSCAGKPTVLDSFEDANSVVIAKIVSVEKSREKDTDDKYDHYYIESAKLVIEKIYKGNKKIGEEITLGQGSGSDCIIVFEEDWIGDKMLLYLRKPSKGHPYSSPDTDKNTEPIYFVSFCGRSTGVESATNDLSYLDNLDKVRGKTRIAGKLDSWYLGSPNFANVEIKIIGKDRIYMTRTDKNGIYEIYDLPAGEYIVEPKAQNGWKIDKYMLRYSASYPNQYDERELESKNQVPIVLQKERHAGLDLYYVVDSHIQGKVLSPKGKPMKGVCVKAVSTELKKGDYRGKSDCTNSKGEFLIDELFSGNYRLVINDDGKIDGDEPFGVLFYPGVEEFDSAGVISIEGGKFLNDVNIQIPKIFDLVTISGNVIYSDGSPYANEWVKFEPTETDKFNSSRIETDKRGKFSMNVPKGATGKLFSEETIYSSRAKDCKVINELLKKSGNTYIDLITDEFIIKADENRSNIRLIFPVPKCKESKD